MVRAPLLVLAAAMLLPLPPGGALPGQAAERWTIEAPRRVSTAVEDVSRGYRALPVSALVGVGAEVARAGDTVEVMLGDAGLRLQVGSPLAHAGGASLRLNGAVYERDGAVFAPLDWFQDVVPRAAAGALTVDAGARRIRGYIPRRADAASAPAGTYAALTLAAPDTAAPTADSVPAPPDEITRLLIARGIATPGADSAGAPASPALPDATPAGGSAEATSAARRRLVVIDAGHGGVDPGAIGPGGVREKDVALAVARRVADLLRDDAALEVRLTRARDTLIALQDRGRMANRWRDEGQRALFLSIHCNSHPSRTVRGVETYFLSEAKTEDARRVARMENAAERYESPAAGGDALGLILGDLRQNQYLRESSDWAEIVQARMAAIAAADRGVRQAGFAVLNGAFMPALLVEIGFVSNAAEEQRLASPDYQRDVARRLAQSVQAFFER